MREGREVFLSVLPFTHSYGQTTALIVPVMMEATMVILPTFITGQVLRAIHRQRPTLFPGVPTMYTAINNFAGAALWHPIDPGVHLGRGPVAGGGAGGL
jgi:long-chain acyl-CoA synthetase